MKYHLHQGLGIQRISKMDKVPALGRLWSITPNPEASPGWVPAKGALQWWESVRATRGQNLEREKMVGFPCVAYFLQTHLTTHTPTNPDPHAHTPSNGKEAQIASEQIHQKPVRSDQTNFRENWGSRFAWSSEAITTKSWWVNPKVFWRFPSP